MLGPSSLVECRLQRTDCLLRPTLEFASEHSILWSPPELHDLGSTAISGFCFEMPDLLPLGLALVFLGQNLLEPFLPPRQRMRWRRAMGIGWGRRVTVDGSPTSPDLPLFAVRRPLREIAMQAVLGQRVPEKPSRVIWAATSGTRPEHPTKMRHRHCYQPQRPSNNFGPSDQD
jgi:hypothetical protein